MDDEDARIGDGGMFSVEVWYGVESLLPDAAM